MIVEINLVASGRVVSCRRVPSSRSLWRNNKFKAWPRLCAPFVYSLADSKVTHASLSPSLKTITRISSCRILAARVVVSTFGIILVSELSDAFKLAQNTKMFYRPLGNILEGNSREAYLDNINKTDTSPYPRRR